MKITATEFIKSSTKLVQCPSVEAMIPEFAFIGRSNVGKSSLINMLVNKKGLAKTSGKPGKTQTINHFLIHSDQTQWYLVDLPGYGYAKTAKSNRKEWSVFITSYLKGRPTLCCTFVLVDSRHEIQKLDEDFLIQMGKWQLPFAIVFTKADKVKPQALEKAVENYKKALLAHYNQLPPFFTTSADSWMGRDEVLSFIDDVLKS
jgi:GTP-binding protein